ncbi:hypothetical protein PY365_06215 [Roseiarcaceae bacterium H3SJ34-1]|uniref:hypothetical protein n=1 Tax=Terripilifer ovatus TaxID=3032367 RepID=UPI003AB9553A|nr:hypothetical protein [Roseiarcaceae bacterium H3SJ34-1]
MKSVALCCALLLAFAAPVLAHETKGPNGGAMVDAGAFHVELTVKDQVIDVFVTDASEKPVTIGGAKGTAILIVGGKPMRITLVAASGNRLSGTATAPLPTAPKGAVQIQLPNGTSLQGKFH